MARPLSAREVLRVELRDLRTFLQVVDSGSITAAALELHLAQSAVSQTVGRLEREIGVRLLERRPDGIRPTAAGADLAAHASEVLVRVAQAELDMAAHRDLDKGELRLGLLPSVVPLLLSRLLRETRRLHPGLRLKVREALLDDLLAGLRADRLDVALIWRPVQEPNLAGGSLFELPLLLIAAADHPLASAEGIEISDLSAEGWVAFPRGGPGRRWIEETCRAGGFEPRIAAELDGLAEITAFVQAGLGITLLPEATIRLEIAAGRLASLPLRGDPPKATLGYLRMGGGAGDPTDAVLDLIRGLPVDGQAA